MVAGWLTCTCCPSTNDTNEHYKYLHWWAAVTFASPVTRPTHSLHAFALRRQYRPSVFCKHCAFSAALLRAHCPLAASFYLQPWGQGMARGLEGMPAALLEKPQQSIDSDIDMAALDVLWDLKVRMGDFSLVQVQQGSALSTLCRPCGHAHPYTTAMS